MRTLLTLLHGGFFLACIDGYSYVRFRACVRTVCCPLDLCIFLQAICVLHVCCSRLDRTSWTKELGGGVGRMYGMRNSQRTEQGGNKDWPVNEKIKVSKNNNVFKTCNITLSLQT